MELYQVPSRELDGWIAGHLQPSKEFQVNVHDAVNRICTFLKEKCSMEARVIKTVKSGSAGKGTTLDTSDVDLVLFLSCFSSYKDQAQKRTSVISNIEQNLIRCCQSIAFKVDILPSKAKGRPPRSLSLIVQSRKNKESVEVDILPAYDVLGQISDSYKPLPQIYINLIQANGKPGEFNTSFTELQRNFVKHRPAKLKDLLRLVKHWYKECKESLRKGDSSLSLPPKFALELLTIYAWEEGTSRAEQFNTAEGFRAVMKLLAQYQDLCLYWSVYYDLEEHTIGTHVKQMLRTKRPVIMDPADPTGDVGKGQGWDLLAKEACVCQNQACCKKNSELVNHWNVKPARNIKVTIKQAARGTRWDWSQNPYDTIWQIKEKIEEKIRVSVYEQCLKLQEPGTEQAVLQDDRTLADYGVFYDTTILLCHTVPQEIEICVKDLNSRTSVYTIRAVAAVRDLKKKIEDRTGISVNQQYLTYNEKDLKDQHTLAYYKIRNKSTVYLLLKLRGGRMLAY